MEAMLEGLLDGTTRPVHWEKGGMHGRGSRALGAANRGAALARARAQRCSSHGPVLASTPGLCSPAMVRL